MGAYVMPIILYSDATLCDHSNKTSRHPVFMMLGNIPLARCNKVDAKILLSYIPSLDYYWPEACVMCATYGSPKSLHPCHSCLVDRNTINNVNLKKENIIIHNENSTKNSLRWGVDLGLFQYQLRFTIELLNLNYGNSAIKILKECLTQIPRYSNLKVFKNGIERFSQLTAAEYRDLMKIMLFVLNELIIDKKLNKNLYDLFYFWIDMYIWSRQTKFTKSDLDKFEVSRQNFFMSLASKSRSRSNNRSDSGIPSKKAIKQMTQHTIDQVINQLQNANNLWINVFDFAYLDNDNKVIIRAVSNYYNQAAFSDVCIEMDELEQNDYLTDNGMCYAKVLLIIWITLSKLDQKLELALVHWYDFAYLSNIKNYYFYKCAVLKFVEHYNLIPITSIANTVHIIPKFNEPGIFFVNRYIDY
ncbi:zn-finger domain-containing protein [Gigaspora margarita]|uniref:Zn-finger domain-containing protein n=1 Tax=Gigaspora margarita TaxID=4874 RepID=A0A8H3X6B6_GIGMA|nr:zn-finger domain-containing protein [Gigaspora margarita]